MSTPIASRILITGYSGFVGGYLVEACRGRYPGAALYGLCQRAPEANPPAAVGGVVPLVADITEADAVRQAVAETRPDLVFHLAGQPSVAASWDDPIHTLLVNAAGAVHLLEALHAEGLAPRVVLVGSGEQYGMVPPEENPIREDHAFLPANPYAVAKAAQDLYGYEYFVAYGLPVLRARSFNQFGPRQASAFVVASFARQIAQIEAGKAAPVLRVGNLTPRRDFLPVEDAVRAYLAMAERGKPGQAYNVGSGQARAIQDILDLLLAQARVPIHTQEDASRMRPIDVPVLTADITRLRADTGWEPSADLEEALGRTLDYWRQVVAAE